MSNALIPLLLDIVVLIFLAATIYYVIRLSRSLNNFKSQRREFDGVITNLLSSIDQAERSINTLKQVSAKEASELDVLIRRSQAMSDELRIINEAGESMATRLERLAEKNREIVQASQSQKAGAPANKRRENRVEDKISSPVPQRQSQYASTLKTVSRDNEDYGGDVDLPSFMIRDPDHLQDNDEEQSQEHLAEEKLQSRAEKELFDALKTSKKNIAKQGNT